MINVRFLVSSVLLYYASAQTDHQNHLPGDSYNGSIQQCTPWSFYDRYSKKCKCFKYFQCNDHDHDGVYLKAGYCATYDTDTEVVSAAPCPYFQSSGFTMTKFDNGYWYVKLPENISELNDYLCGAMDRTGRVCSKCKDGFGPAVMSIGFQIPCSKCIGVWYGIPLYLFLELFPVTIFYLIFLIFQINITTAPMTSYIMYSQLVIIVYDRLFSGDMPVLTGILFSMNKHYQQITKVIISIYEVWNLCLFHQLIPPFCISSRLKPIHIAFLGYISVFYPLCLIFLTWACVELQDRNFRPIVWLWKPFHRCSVHLRRGWNTKSDLIDVFASFFLLSFTKCLYQVLLFMTDQKIYKTSHLRGIYSDHIHVLNLDLNIPYGSTEHFIFAIPALIICCVFNVLPTLLLLFYPFSLFRACLSKCKLNGPALYTFVEKFYGCYRNGLDGGKDMRSFASLHFILRVAMLFTKGVGSLLLISNYDPYFIRDIVFTATLVLISLCRPHKEMYNNVLDVLILAHLGLQCHLVSSYQGFGIQAIFELTLTVTFLLPFAGFILLVSIRAVQIVIKSRCFRAISQRSKQICMCVSTTEQASALIETTVTTGISYGSTIH